MRLQLQMYLLSTTFTTYRASPCKELITSVTKLQHILHFRHSQLPFCGYSTPHQRLVANSRKRIHNASLIKKEATFWVASHNIIQIRYSFLVSATHLVASALISKLQRQSCERFSMRTGE
jgi:hypothetical protein